MSEFDEALQALMDGIKTIHIPEPDRPTWLWRATCRHCGAAIVKELDKRYRTRWVHAK